MSHPSSPLGTQSFYARHFLAILFVVVFLLPLAIVGAMKAKTNNRNDVRGWLPIEYEETRIYRAFREQFQGEEFVLVSWDGCTLGDQRLELMARKLVPAKEERSEDDPPLMYKTVLTGPQVIERMTSEPLNLDREEAINRLTGSLVGPAKSNDEPLDQRQTCLVVTLSDEGRKNLHRPVDHIISLAEKECAIKADELHLGGPPVDNVAIDNAGQRSLMTLLGLSLGVGAIVSWFSLKSGRLVAIVIVTGVYSMALSLAIVWYTGSPVDAIVLTMPSLVYVATTSGAIHLSNYYRDEVAETGSRLGAAGRALRHAALPLGLATGTTAAGLLTLCYSELIPIQMFGIYSAVGVTVSLLLLVFFIPAALECWPPKLRIGALAKTEEELRKWKTPEDTRWWRAGRWILDHNKSIAMACLAVMLLVGYGIFKAETNVQLMRFFSSRARILHDYRWLEANLGPLVPMEIVVHIDRSIHDDLDSDERAAKLEADRADTATNPPPNVNVKRLSFLDRMELIGQIQRRIEAVDEVGSALSTATFSRDLDLGGSSGAAGKIFGINRRTKRSVLNRRLLAHRHELLAGEYLRDWKNPDSGKQEELWRISARVSALKNVDYADFTQQLQAVVEPLIAAQNEKGVHGISVAYTGLIPLVYKAQHSLMDGLVFGFLTDFALIVVVMIVACRQWSVGIILLLPSAFPAIAVFGGMGWLHALLKSRNIDGMFIDIGTVMAPAVALGVTVDDVVHYLLWFRRGIQEGMDRKGAVMLAYKGCARAMYQSWGVIGIGLSAFALSPFGPTQRFGLMMLSMLTVALGSNLLFMPTLLAGPMGAIFEHGIKRKMRRTVAKSKVEETTTRPQHQFHRAETPVVPPPKSKTIPAATPIPPLPVGSSVVPPPKINLSPAQPTAAKPPMSHIGLSKAADKKPNAA
ncbi:MAG: MMPL family transporter [Pirellulales bacterium]|nr:MMPL family transporter [Pirellulales bacterium]